MLKLRILSNHHSKLHYETDSDSDFDFDFDFGAYDGLSVDYKYKIFYAILLLNVSVGLDA